jgi:hypothetical protein
MTQQTQYTKYSNEPNFSGYPYFFIVDNKDCWCADCCNEELDGGEKVITAVNYEDPDLYCWNCSAKIEAAYIEERDSKET